MLLRCKIVLIETLWNVKQNWGGFQPQGQYRINRNIVECKVAKVLDFCIKTERINRNIVECKDTSQVVCGCQSRGINRNIVECKVEQL